ncbi:MAG TPA: hypothetical protein VK669_04160 [Candidatus Limnocylindrales bacterium]|nr:hypothetical protein [Candidatus Limnocylindrales bacterium]
MLNELVRRLGAGKADRRAAERKRKRFPIGWLKDGAMQPALGLEISEKGVLFASRDAPADSHVDVAIDLGGRRVRARLKVARQGTMGRDGVDWTIIAGVFEGIAADDWDAVVRFCKDVAEPPNKAAEELSAQSGDDDAYRLLPLRIQQRIVAALVAAGRLAPGSDAKNPLLRMSYAGKNRSGTAHRLAVTSRRVDDGEVLQFDSFVTVDDAGNVQLER